MELSTTQARALDSVVDWYTKRKQHQQVFSIFGYAGTGKTTLAKQIADACGCNVEFAAFTGKAAYVLSQKGCKPSSTIHQLIYRPITRPGGKVEFVLDDESLLYDADLLILDEVSMVGEDLGTDLLSFGKPVLVLGDPAQLPPIHGAGFFDTKEPDIMLTEIHRQAEGNPIIRMATEVRHGKVLNPNDDWGDSSIISELSNEVALGADQIIVGKNVTRQRSNARMRQLLGFEGTIPLPEEKLICLKNNHKLGLLNGSMWTVVSAKKSGAFYLMDLEGENKDRILRDISVHPDYFLTGTAPTIQGRRDPANHFDYGYAVTCHKAQGSQWDKLVIIDESHVFRQDRNRWLYTAITRAADRLSLYRRKMSFA